MGKLSGDTTGNTLGRPQIDRILVSLGFGRLSQNGHPRHRHHDRDPPRQERIWVTNLTRDPESSSCTAYSRGTSSLGGYHTFGLFTTDPRCHLLFALAHFLAHFF